MARILIVEDDADIRQLVAAVLAEDGYETEEAADGMAALDKVRNSTPDAVVLDLYMPRMDGFEFLNVCRMVPGCAKMPVLVLTASDQLPVDKRVRACLKKPFDLNVLSKAVDSLVGGASTVTA